MIPERNNPVSTDPALLRAAFREPSAVFLTSCGHEDAHGRWQSLLASADENAPAWTSPGSLLHAAPGWKFGFLSYDLRTSIETSLSSHRPVTLPVPQLWFFEPQFLQMVSRSGEVTQHGEISLQDSPGTDAHIRLRSPLTSSLSRKAYTEAVAKVRDHISEGDFYELNLCREFSADAFIPDPVSAFLRLMELSPMPFSALVRKDHLWVLCASPERFLQLHGNSLLTQPIKGTIRRGKDKQEDEALKEKLRHSEKDRAENVMITDLSRNDLNRSCLPGTVHVPELFGIHTFPQLHHMISSVEGKLSPHVSPLQSILNAFPPGSMTGAPKVRVMQAIEALEPTGRGIYSGSIGYFTPEGEFDFNVVIRSLVYDAAQQKISFHVGGAITWDSDADAEWEETEVKAAALMRLIEGR